jgi:Family of unknown function (DUF5681)
MSQDQDDDRGEYRVGYRKPPKHTQFKPGQSGNPGGRKPLFGNFEADLIDELATEISVRENGVERQVSKQRAVINTLVTAAISGNMRASGALLSILARALPSRTEHDSETDSDANDEDLLKRFDRRQRRTGMSKPAKKPSNGGGS